MAIINGTDGNDALIGTDGADTFNPLAGADTVDGLEGSDTLVLDYTDYGVADPYAEEAEPNRNLSQVASAGGAFAGDIRVPYGSDSVSFANIEHLRIVLNRFDDLFILDGTALAQGGTIDLDAGAGSNDRLEADFTALSALNLNLASGEATGSFGRIANFEEFRLLLTDGADIVTAGNGWDTISGGGGNDQLNGGGGWDWLHGGHGDDRIDGGSGSDRLEGAEGADVIFSHAADPAFIGYSNPGISYDVLAEADTLTGGAGNDYLFAGYGDDVDGGTQDLADRLYISFKGASSGVVADFRLLANQSAITIGDGVVTGIESVDFIEGSDFDDLLAPYSVAPYSSWVYGRGGNDHLIAHKAAGFGGGGFWGGDGNDVIDASQSQYGPALYGEAGDDVLTSGSASDALDGGAGNDILTFWGGNQVGLGGEGDDVFRFNQTLTAADRIEGGAGFDRLFFTGTFEYSLTFGAATMTGVEHITLAAGFGYQLVMNDGNVAAGQRLAVDASGVPSALKLRFDGSAELDGAFDVEGGAGDDVLKGGDGDDVLTGGPGADSLDGGAGNDTADYSLETGGGGIIVNLSGALVHRFPEPPLQPGQARDSYGTVDMLANVENIRTGSGDDHVVGNAAANRIETGGGRDWVDGGAGADYLAGGAGDDFYLVFAADSAAFEDVIVELANGGSDQIRTTFATFSLADLPEVESLFGIVNIPFTLTGNDRDNYLIGNNSADTLVGGLGNDMLEGWAGNDTMRGGPGDDTYVVNEIGDVVEENSGEGIDLVYTSLASYSLVGTNIENLFSISISGIAHDFRGNAGNNVIFGNDGNDNLRLQDGGDDDVFGDDGNDNIFMIGSLTSADYVDGGAGADTLILQGAYAGGLTLSANVTNIELISILAGSNTNFGEPGTNRHDYVLTVNDANFSGGIQARINGSALLAGEDFTFDGSAELDSRFVVYGGRGVDTLTGSQNADIFFLAEDRFATGDTVNGGAGYDGMFLRGNYTIDFNAPGYTGLFTNIENLTLTSATDERYARGGGTEFDYNLTLSDAIVKPGELLTISGALLMASETMIVDASAETNGFLNLFGGKANDTLKGGASADLLHGNLGADQLTGNGGADTFRYQGVGESTASSLDHILDFAAGVDKVDLTRVDADTLTAGNQTFNWIGSNAFSGTAGQLRAYQSGSDWFVEGDTNGDSVADLVIQLTVTGGPLSQGDFLP